MSGTTRDDEIWDRHQTGASYAEIAKSFGLSASRIRHICNRRLNRAGLAKRDGIVADKERPN